MKSMSLPLSVDTSVAQLIDANLDRAKEGLRVVEDWCRFNLGREDIVIQLKNWRQQLGAHHFESYKKSRSTATDQGLGLSHPAQLKRTKPIEIVSANCARIQEATRVLEEFTRLSNPELATTAANIRYGVYEIEKKLLESSISSRRHRKLNSCKICLITHPQQDLIQKVKLALEGGVGMIQFRCKKYSDLEKISQARQIASLCKEYKSLFIINDRLDIALAVDADGVHLGQNDIPTNIARKILGEERLIGKSTNCLEQLHLAHQEGCDYLGVGPINKTSTKPEINPVGLSYVREASKESNLPWFAIGGINESNIKEVASSGAKKIAVIGAIMNSDNPKNLSMKLIEALQ